jgi:hypothetical protein
LIYSRKFGPSLTRSLLTVRHFRRLRVFGLRLRCGFFKPPSTVTSSMLQDGYKCSMEADCPCDCAVCVCEIILFIGVRSLSTRFQTGFHLVNCEESALELTDVSSYQPISYLLERLVCSSANELFYICQLFSWAILPATHLRPPFYAFCRTNSVPLIGGDFAALVLLERSEALTRTSCRNANRRPLKFLWIDACHVYQDECSKFAAARLDRAIVVR